MSFQKQESNSLFFFFNVILGFKLFSSCIMFSFCGRPLVQCFKRQGIGRERFAGLSVDGIV